MPLAQTVVNSDDTTHLTGATPFPNDTESVVSSLLTAAHSGGIVMGIRRDGTSGQARCRQRTRDQAQQRHGDLDSEEGAGRAPA
jgi:hypothetical protein